MRARLVCSFAVAPLPTGGAKLKDGLDAPGGKMVVFEPRVFALTLAVAVGIGALAGLYPSWRASHVPPMEAVRNE